MQLRSDQLKLNWAQLCWSVEPRCGNETTIGIMALKTTFISTYSFGQKQDTCLMKKIPDGEKSENFVLNHTDANDAKSILQPVLTIRVTQGRH